MDNYQCQTVSEVMEQFQNVHVKEKHGSQLKFRMYLTKEMQETPLEVLDLNVRPLNCLKRAGFKTVGDVVDAVASEQGISGLRNCGAKSVREIKEHLFLYQYYMLPKERQEAFLMEVILLNKGIPDI